MREFLEGLETLPGSMGYGIEARVREFLEGLETVAIEAAEARNPRCESS